MTALNRTPANPNLLHANKFQFNFSRAPNLQYFCQSVLIPGISLMDVPKNNPFVDLYSPGEKAIYDTLNITFLIDEDLTAWREVHDWIRGMTFPTDFSEYRSLRQNRNYIASESRKGFEQFSDGALTILSTANKPAFKFKFYDMFPLSVTSFPLSSTDSPETIITADATFRFAYYDVEVL